MNGAGLHAARRAAWKECNRAMHRNRKTKGVGKRDLAAIKQSLLARQAELLRDAIYLANEASRSAPDAPGAPDVADYAEIGSDCFEQELELGLLENEQKVLEEIGDALMRIETGTFGMCEVCGEPLSRERLAALPYARLCLPCKRKEEQLFGESC